MDSALQRIVESLNRDLEEKIYQLSQVRQVAESVTRSIHEAHFFPQLCSDCVEIFNASVCCLFWQRYREPRSWWLDAWADRRGKLHPLHKMIPEEEEGIFGWIKRLQKPHYIEDAAGEPFLKIWGDEAPARTSAALLPLTADESRMGMLTLIDPVLRLSPRNIQLQLEILGSLVNSGVHNRLLYKDLQNSEEEFRDLFENSSDMVVVTYPDGVIRDCNSRFKEVLRLSADPRGMRLTELISDDFEGTFAECWNSLVQGREVQSVNITLRREDEGTIEAELSGNVRLLGEGRPGLIRLYLRDVTERRRSEQRQRELEFELELARERQLAQVGLYVSGIAHNLRNPVQVLLGYIELLRMKKVSIPELNVIEQSTQSIMDIIQNLLDKMEKERSPQSTDVDLNELLTGELTFLNANTYFKHEVTKKYQFADDLPLVKGVYSDFSQALMNIIYNALDAMKESETKILKVRTAYLEEEELIRISITDSGPGIPEEVRERVFEPFFTTKRKDERDQTELSSGSGLGLSSSVALLKPYGATIRFETEIGRGTTFHVLIPVARLEGDR